MKQQNSNIPQGYKNSPFGVIPDIWEKLEVIDFTRLSLLVQQTQNKSYIVISISATVSQKFKSIVNEENTIFPTVSGKFKSSTDDIIEK